MIALLAPHGQVYITSERPLSPQLEPYRLHINPLDIHHIMAFASLYIGDSQSMAVEAAMLGTPSIRFNDFAGKIGVLEELEHKYRLTYGIPSSQPEELYQKIEELLDSKNLRETFRERRDAMLKDKIDVTAFLVEVIETLDR
jgi:predicted glycosyltransferase